MRPRAFSHVKPNYRVFEKGELENCPCDTKHFVERGRMDMHLEFRIKYQSQQVVVKFQEQQKEKLVHEMGNLNIHTYNII